jgi:SAM-dependent methyltransferase
MNHFIHGVVRAAAESFLLPEPMLEIGSYQVAGQEGLSLRPLFAGRHYTGVDFRAGPGVDSVEDVERLSRPNASVGTVLALNVFEHVRVFWRGFSEVHRVLREDGVLIASAPFYFHIHSHPNDYWRFTPEAFKTLLEDYSTKIIGVQGPAKRPTNVWALAFNREAEFNRDQLATFRTKLGAYARERIGFKKQTWYGFCRWFVGRRPFEPWLDASRCDFEVLAA